MKVFANFIILMVLMIVALVSATPVHKHHRFRNTPACSTYGTPTKCNNADPAGRCQWKSNECTTAKVTPTSATATAP